MSVRWAGTPEGFIDERDQPIRGNEQSEDEAVNKAMANTVKPLQNAFPQHKSWMPIAVASVGGFLLYNLLRDDKVEDLGSGSSSTEEKLDVVEQSLGEGVARLLTQYVPYVASATLNQFDLTELIKSQQLDPYLSNPKVVDALVERIFSEPALAMQFVAHPKVGEVISAAAEVHSKKTPAESFVDSMRQDSESEEDE